MYFNYDIHPLIFFFLKFYISSFFPQWNQKTAYEEGWKAKKANQMELQQVGKNQAMLWAKTASWILHNWRTVPWFWTDLLMSIFQKPSRRCIVTQKISGPDFSMIMKLSSYKMQKFLFFLVKRQFFFLKHDSKRNTFLQTVYKTGMSRLTQLMAVFGKPGWCLRTLPFVGGKEYNCVLTAQWNKVLSMVTYLQSVQETREQQ